MLKRPAETDFRFNQQKCKFNKKEVSYVGYVFNQKGLKLCPYIVKAFTNLPVSTNKKSLQTFMKKVNY